MPEPDGKQSPPVSHLWKIVAMGAILSTAAAIHVAFVLERASEQAQLDPTEALLLTDQTGKIDFATKDDIERCASTVGVEAAATCAIEALGPTPPAAASIQAADLLFRWRAQSDGPAARAAFDELERKAEDGLAAALSSVINGRHPPEEHTIQTAKNRLGFALWKASHAMEHIVWEQGIRKAPHPTPHPFSSKDPIQKTPARGQRSTQNQRE